jgi:acyl-CoA synthetase (AMP-forming)/AMP-acid ligase II
MLTAPQDATTLLDLLTYRATAQPHDQAYIFLKDGETQTLSLTYQALDQQARAVAQWLQAHTQLGDRVLLIYPYDAGLDFIAAFFGCLYAQRIAVSGHPPRNQSGWAEVTGRLEDAAASALLSTQPLLKQFQSRWADQPAPPIGCATERLPPTDWTPIPLSPDQLAFLQYTSGSTGQPKGVEITHASLIQNQKLLQLAFGHTHESVGVGWLPLFHDMGLIGNVLQALYVGAPCVLMSPMAFVQKPIRWLEAISRYRATTSGAPNFAYDLLARKVTEAQIAQLDLSSWQVAFTGAEPVRVETLDRFSARFAACGFRRSAFYPCYGMAEATLFVSGGQKQTPPTVIQVDQVGLDQNRVLLSDGNGPSLVSCGQGWLDTEIAIVDPQSQTPCLPDQIGEIWVAGSGLGRGYWQQPQATAERFAARLPGREPDFLRTGDLGFLHKGELFITGRLHDVLVFWGFNHYPQQLEQTVEACHPGFRANSSSAFAVKVNGEERLVIVQEVERQYRDLLTLKEIIEVIRWRLFEEHFVDLYCFALLKPGSLPKTSSGKVQRSAARQQFLDQQLAILDQWQLPDDIPTDPASTLQRYLNPATHLHRYSNLTTAKIQRYLLAIFDRPRTNG